MSSSMDRVLASDKREFYATYMSYFSRELRAGIRHAGFWYFYPNIPPVPNTDGTVDRSLVSFGTRVGGREIALLLFGIRVQPGALGRDCIDRSLSLSTGFSSQSS